LKAEEGDAGSRAVVLLIDTEGAKPEGSDKSEGSTAEVIGPVAEAPKRQLHQPDSSSSYPAATYLGHLQLQEKF
jgi:hypothetical protein